MNRNRWLSSLCLVACLVIALYPLASPAQTQAQAHPRNATADIPFDFYVSGNKLPAGAYSLDMIAPTYVMLRSKDGKIQQDLYFMQDAVPGKNPPSQVVFAVRDGKYYFAEVWGWFGKSQLTSFTAQPGDGKKEVPLTPTEKKVAKPAGSL
jgi:hypothetical protein